MNRLEAIKAREGKATKGPWIFRHRQSPYNDVRLEQRETLVGILWLSRSEHPDLDMQEHDSQDDMDFITEARDAIPWLIERLEEAKGMMGRIQPMIFAHQTRYQIQEWLKSLEES